MYYYLKEDIKSKHKLTNENYKRVLILAKFLYVTCFEIWFPFVFLFISWFYLYIAIKCKIILLQLLTPFVLYMIWLITSTAFLGASLAMRMIYYYILLFKQINIEMDIIYKEIKLFITMRSQKQLIWLTERHNLFALEMNRINLLIRRTVLGFFVVLSLGLIIPLNLYLKSNNEFEQIIYLIIFFDFLLYGFGISYLMSSVIRFAHKPYKTIYQILRKQNFLFNSKRNFYYKWKVTSHN